MTFTKKKKQNKTRLKKMFCDFHYLSVLFYSVQCFLLLFGLEAESAFAKKKRIAITMFRNCIFRSRSALIERPAAVLLM